MYTCCLRSSRDVALPHADCLHRRSLPDADMTQVSPLSKACQKWLFQQRLKIPADADMSHSRLYQAVTTSLFGCDSSLQAVDVWHSACFIFIRV